MSAYDIEQRSVFFTSENCHCVAIKETESQKFTTELDQF